MTANIYAVKDNLNGFITLTLDDNDQTATRNFACAVLNDATIIGFAPCDFDLYYLGTFDSESGCITQDKMPRLVARGANIAAAYKMSPEMEDIDDE